MTETLSLIETLDAKLRAEFTPQFLEIINESHLHAGHQPGFDGTGESHIRVRMVSEKLNGLSRVNIHRAINAACQDALDRGLHALAIDAKGTE
ncbi:MAG: BolA family protein [Pseudomonadota bacterium]